MAHYPYMEPTLITQLDEIQARVEALVKERDALRGALLEAQCWMPFRGEGSSPSLRGAKCETLTEARSMVNVALAGGRS